MSNITGGLRERWHAKGKDGGKESWRSDFKGVNQVAGWVGKGKSTDNQNGSGTGPDHVSRPLATLKDPASFGPPPKNVNFHGGAALPNQTTPDRRGIGAPLSRTQAQGAEGRVQGTDEAKVEQQPVSASPPVPYRANRTSSKTDHVLPPPVLQPVGSNGQTTQETGIAQITPKPKPSLPPRLPPRSSSSNHTSPVTTSPPPSYDSVLDESKPAEKTYLNQGAIDRLGKAGISVPGFSMGATNKAPTTERVQSTSSQTPQLSGLQSRFSRMNTSSPPSQPAADEATSQSQSSAQGTTLAQKQSALQTAQSFHKDPSSVSLTDAQSAATTANNFRERHQDQVAAGAQKATSWNKRYNLTGKMNSLMEQQTEPAKQEQVQTQQPMPQMGQGPSPTPASQGAGTPDPNNRKPPPPPPPKKPSGMHGQATGTVFSDYSGQAAPPPVPLETKPSFG